MMLKWFKLLPEWVKTSCLTSLTTLNPHPDPQHSSIHSYRFPTLVLICMMKLSSVLTFCQGVLQLFTACPSPGWRSSQDDPSGWFQAVRHRPEHQVSAAETVVGCFLRVPLHCYANDWSLWLHLTGEAPADLCVCMLSNPYMKACLTT